MAAGYDIEVDRTDKVEWENSIQSFDDANLFQTWSWGAVRWGEKNLTHVVLKKDGRVVAAAQAWIIRVPFLGKGIAYVKRGPMWLVRNGEADHENYRLIIRALREEYTEKRGLLLRVMPNVTADSSGVINRAMADEGFRPPRNHVGYRTFLIDLACDLEYLRKGLKKKWRQNLSGAMKKGLTVEEGFSDELFDTAAGVYSEMRARKRFAEHLGMDELRRIQTALGRDIKMRIIICRYMGRPVTAYISSLVGGTGVDVISGTVSDGLYLNSAYLAHWRMLSWLKSSGCRWYDLGGIEPVNFPGPYTFKSGLSGANGKDTTFRQFDFCRGYSSEVAVKAADSLNHAYRYMKEVAAKIG